MIGRGLTWYDYRSATGALGRGPVASNNPPETPYKGHDGICASFRLFSKRRLNNDKAHTLMLLGRNHLGNGGLQDTDIAACRRLSVIRSASVYRTRQQLSYTYPLSRPPRAHASSATCKFGARPKIIMLSAVPASPTSRTGLRPTLSLSLPHGTPDENSAKAKADVTVPAYTAIVAGPCLLGSFRKKSSIIK